MSSVAGSTRKLSEEIIDTLTDKIASLKAAGRMDEALEEEKKLARVQRQFKGEQENMSLDDTLTPNEKAAASFSAEGWQKPPAQAGMTPTGMPEVDATDWTASLRPSSEEAFSKDLSSLPGERMEQVGDVTIRRKIPGKALAAGGAAGLAASSTLGDATRPPITPAPEEEEKPEIAKQPPPASGTGEPGMAQPTTVQPEEARNFLKGLTEMPAAPDMTEWRTSLASVADARQAKANELKASILEAKAAADVAASSVERRELIETISNAIGQVVAGMYGMKHGLDLSGAKFNKTDWNAKLDQINNQLKQNIAVLKDQQELDQAVISERKDALMQDKEALLRTYENDWKRWSGKAQIAQAQQTQENRRVDNKLKADMFNTEMGVKAQEAIRKAAKDGKTEKDQISAGLKASLKEQDDLLAKWNELAVKAGDKKASSGQREAILAQMEQIDRQYTQARGFPILASDTDPLTPATYAGLDEDDVVEKARNRFAAQDALIQKVGQFRNKQALPYVQNPERYMAEFAQAAVKSGMNPVAAAEYAQKEYAKGIKLMFEQQRKFEAGASGAK